MFITFQLKQKAELWLALLLHHDQLLKLTTILEHVQGHAVNDKPLLGVVRYLDLCTGTAE